MELKELTAKIFAILRVDGHADLSDRINEIVMSADAKRIYDEYFKDYEGDGFRLKEAIERDIKLKVTHWIPIPPLPIQENLNFNYKKSINNAD